MIIENIFINGWENLKKVIKDYTALFFDIILYFFIISYFNYYNELGQMNYEILIAGTVSLLLRIIYYVPLYFKNFEGMEKKDYLNTMMIPKILFFTMYLSFMYLEIENTEIEVIKVKYQIITNQIIQMSGVLLFFSIFFIYKSDQKLKTINQILNLIFVISFSFIISSNEFIELKNYVFGISKINLDKDSFNISIYTSIILLFLITYPYKDENLLYDYGKKICLLITITTIVIIYKHIAYNLNSNSVDYALITYYMAVMLTTIIIVNLITDININKTALNLSIVFKLMIILYVMNNNWQIVPDNLIAIALFFILNIFVFKKPLSLFNFRLMLFLVFMVIISLVYFEFKNFINNTKIETNISGFLTISAYLIGLSIMKKKPKSKTLNIIKDIFNLLFTKKIHKSVRLKNEKASKKKYYIPKKNISIFFIASLLFIVMHHYINNYLANIANYSNTDNIYNFENNSFIDYVKNENEISKKIIKISESLEFKLIIGVIWLISLIFSTSVTYMTNERVIRVSLFELKYYIYEYNSLEIKIINNKKHLEYENKILFNINDKLSNYLEKKIIESKQNK